jgi:hypothetical protein
MRFHAVIGNTSCTRKRRKDIMSVELTGRELDMLAAFPLSRDAWAQLETHHKMVVHTNRAFDALVCKIRPDTYRVELLAA